MSKPWVLVMISSGLDKFARDVRLKRRVSRTTAPDACGAGFWRAGKGFAGAVRFAEHAFRVAGRAQGPAFCPGARRRE